MAIKQLKKAVSILVIITFLFSNIAYGDTSSRQLFKGKKVDQQKLSDQKEETLKKTKSVIKGEETSASSQPSRQASQRILSSHLEDLSQIHIPAELGSVIEVYQAPKNPSTNTQPPLIVNIQDLHTNPEGQLNLASILEILLKDYNMGVICSEGADGKVDTSSVSSFPDKEVREKTAKLFINSGELTGEEYLSITKYPDLPIWGIEDKDVYFKNIAEFNDIMKYNPEAESFISQIKKALNALKPKIYSKEILSLDQKEADYEAQNIKTDAYLKDISSYIQKLNIPTDDYPNIAILNETVQTEKKINQQKIMQDTQNLLLNLQTAIQARNIRSDMDSLTAKAQLFKDEKISPFSFYSYLKDLAQKHLKDQMSKYQDLNEFIDYLTKVNSLDSTKLFIEMEALTFDIKQRLAKRDEEKTLTQALRNIKFLEGFFDLKISNEELKYYLQNKDSHKVGFFEAFLKPAINKYNIDSSIDFNPDLIDAKLSEIEEFYQTVKSRDGLMFNNTIAQVEKRNAKVTALITGGFHTKGITSLLREKGYSYIVVAPYAKQEIDEENYHFLLSGKRKPVEDLIKQLDTPEEVTKKPSQDKLRVPVNQAVTKQRIEQVLEEISRSNTVKGNPFSIDAIGSLANKAKEDFLSRHLFEVSQIPNSNRIGVKIKFIDGTLEIGMLPAEVGNITTGEFVSRFYNLLAGRWEDIEKELGSRDYLPALMNGIAAETKIQSKAGDIKTAEGKEKFLTWITDQYRASGKDFKGMVVKTELLVSALKAYSPVKLLAELAEADSDVKQGGLERAIQKYSADTLFALANYIKDPAVTKMVAFLDMKKSQGQDIYNRDKEIQVKALPSELTKMPFFKRAAMSGYVFIPDGITNTLYISGDSMSSPQEEKDLYALYYLGGFNLANMLQIIDAVKLIKSQDLVAIYNSANAEHIIRREDPRRLETLLLNGQSLLMLEDLSYDIASRTGKTIFNVFGRALPVTGELGIDFGVLRLRMLLGSFSETAIGTDIVYSQLSKIRAGEDVPMISSGIAVAYADIKQLARPVSAIETIPDIAGMVLAVGREVAEGQTASPSVLSWQEFEKKEIDNREIDQRQRNLSTPQKIAFNIDIFPASGEVLTITGLHRMFDSMFRLLEGNPNFTPVAIFLNDYAEGMPSSFERLARFLQANPATGKAKYKIKLDKKNNVLIINGHKIALYKGFAEGDKLRDLGVNFLIEAPRQKYLDFEDGRAEIKETEEVTQKARIDGYLRGSKDLRVVVIAPEEDKGKALAETPVVFKVNSAATVMPKSRIVVLAEPITTAAGIMSSIVENTARAASPRANVTVSEVRVVRTDRQGDRLIDVPDIQAASALNRVLKKEDSHVHTVVTDGGAIYGTANSMQVVFTITGFMTELTADTINQAFREAGREGLLRGLIDFKGRDTVSGFEAHNTHPLIFLPLKPEDVKVVRPSNGPSYRTITLRGFYTEAGYAKSALDLMTGLAIFDGKKALQKETEGVDVAKEVIPPTTIMVRPQVVPDGKPMQVVLNSARGRMAIGIQRRLWFDPNFKIVGINGVRPAGKDITALFMEHDEVSEEAPFTVRVNNDNTFTFRDREERVTAVSSDATAFSETRDGIKSTVLHTVYGNLYVEQNKDGISLIRFHGERISKIQAKDNKNGTFTAQGELKNGTTVKLTYSQKTTEKFSQLISSAIRKQDIVKFTNVRPIDKNAYKQAKGEKEEDFIKRAEAFNRVYAEEVMANMPWLNGDVLFMDASGQLTEAMKLKPFYMAGAGVGLISAPAKATAKSSKAADVTIVPGVSDQYVLSTWDIIKTVSCASCTTNGAAVGAKALLSIVNILSGNFDTVHALTNTQGRMFGDIPEGSKAGLDRGVDARRHIAYSDTGASRELANALPELTNIVSGVALRVANDDGSLVNYVFHVNPKDGTEIPSAEKINELVKGLTEVPGKAGGLQGFLGYGSPKSSLEVINTGIAGIFDPSKTHVDPNTGAVSISIWYDNEGGYVNQYINLALLMGLYKAERAREIDVVAQNVVPTQGAYTGRVSVRTAKQSGATSVIIGSGRFRAFDEEANKFRAKKVDVNNEANKALKEALSAGIDSPILNIYISDVDQRRGAEAAINSQISEALKDISSDDIARITVSLEADDPRLIDEYVVMARNAVSGYAAKAFMSRLAAEKDGVLKEIGTAGYKAYIEKLKAISAGVDETEIIANYAKLLGSNVSQKVRLVIKFNGLKSKDSIIELAKKADIDGFIFSNQFDIGAINDIARGISIEVANDQDKQVELNKRRSPRFFICADAGFSLDTDLSNYANILLSGVDSHNVQLAIAPPLTELRNLASLLKGEVLPASKAVPSNKVPVRVLLQNATLSADKEGEGLVNLDYAVENLGIHDVLFGHSEIIELMGISDREIAELAKHAHELKRNEKLTGNVIVAVGETEADYSANNSGKIIRTQVKSRLRGLTASEIADTVIAYEPRWAIGTGRTPTNKEIQDMHSGIRNAVKDLFGLEASQKVRIIYGGSLTLQNAEGILKLKDVDGALIGGASTSPEVFSNIVTIAQNISDAKNSERPYYRKLYIAGNHKAMEVKDPYARFVGAISGVLDRRKVEVAIGPELPRIAELAEVYAKDPLKDIVFIDQLAPEEIRGKVFFVRVDFNVPIEDIKAEPTDPDTWKITSDARIREAMPTIDTIRENGGIAVLVTHFEPKGVNLKGPQSIRFLTSHIESLLGDGAKIKFVGDILGSARQSALKGAREGDVILLENIRLNPDIAKLEKAATDKPEDIKVRANLAAKLYAGPNDKNPKANVVVVSDGFGVMHRNQGSVTGSLDGVPRIGGLLLEKELKFGIEAIRSARRPIALVFGGGAKVGDKVPMLKHIILNTLRQGDKIFVYGGAAMPFLMAKDSSFEPGRLRTLFDNATVNMAREIMELAEEEGVEIVLPVDFVVGDNLPSDETQKVSASVVSRDSVTPDKGAYDIGPETVKRFREEILDEQGRSRFGLIINNGPAGAFEYEQFKSGTQGVFEVMAEATKTDENSKGAVTVVGGGDTGYAAELMGVDKKLSFVSTGGGAFLELLQGLDLPGIEVLRGKAGELSYHLNTNIGPAAYKIRSIMSDYAASSSGL